ncbi:MAG: quinone-interacting membrane-bound oxidoreductase complex subunit QmoC [Pseudomonadota bacterium]
MAGETFINPDVGFIKDLQDNGADSLKKCFQCATCAVVCPLSPDDKPFPRKEMIWAQWGLKEKLMGDPHVWLCHQCNDCSTYCPRGARPGDVLAAIRAYMIKSYAFPKFMGEIVGDKKYLPMILLIPLLIILAVVSAIGRLYIPAGDVVYSKFLPIPFVDSIFLPAAALAFIFMAVGVRNFWNDLNRTNRFVFLGKGKFWKTLVDTIFEVLKHDRFRKCEANKGRFIAHLGVFFGFALLFTATNMVVFYEYILHRETPLPLYDPAKVTGNIGALLLVVGIALVLRNRTAGQEKNGGYLDWALIFMILGVAVSGILTELLRLLQVPVAAYPMYVAHLVFVFYIIGYLPFSKLAHMVYRTLAMAYMKHLEGPPRL